MVHPDRSANQDLYSAKLPSLHRVRTLIASLLAANLLEKELVHLASSAGKKATGPGTAPSHHLAPILMQEKELVRLASSVGRLDTGQKTAPCRILVLVLEIERLRVLSALLLANATKVVCLLHC